MRERKAAMVRRASLSPEAQAGRRAPRPPAVPGVAQTAGAGRWGSVAMAVFDGDDLRRGGGGGGGLFGGGGGGGPRRTPDVSDFAPAGGGGGGSNLVPEGGTATLDDSGDPSIAISYQGGGLGEEPPTKPENKQACKKGGWKELGFKNQGQASRPSTPITDRAPSVAWGRGIKSNPGPSSCPIHRSAWKGYSANFVRTVLKSSAIRPLCRSLLFVLRPPEAPRPQTPPVPRPPRPVAAPFPRPHPAPPPRRRRGTPASAG